MAVKARRQVYTGIVPEVKAAKLQGGTYGLVLILTAGLVTEVKIFTKYCRSL